MDIDIQKNRAWIEVNLEHLKYNVEMIQKMISSSTEIMAVVKANAYGHGIIEVSRKLEQIGIQNFAVATLDEGITLRTSGITGNILILGYTSPVYLKYVKEYDLIQTVVDEDYATMLLSSSISSLKVHVKVNTGMNRLGISYKHVDFIENLYGNEKLKVLGIYSHLCVSDSDSIEDIEFTKLQIQRFTSLLDDLRGRAVIVGVTHLQASYGILNYPSVSLDMVRLGIFMYGVLSEENLLIQKKLKLRPVLSLKARITSIHEVDFHESVGYGRNYRAKQKEKIATVSIGYADGIPRNVSCGEVFLGQKKYPIVGNICMDQLMIRIGESSFQVGDIVSIFGDGILVEEMAKKANTVTNELLCRLGSRLPRIYIGKEGNKS